MNYTLRKISAINVLSFMDDMNLEWSKSLNDTMQKYDGFKLILEQIEKKLADTLVNQAC